jgi:hypothetical protein
VVVFANYLQAELKSMSGVTMDSTRLLTEKLGLARELSTIKPELEHLRSQAAHQQTILSEKLALQRQVSTLEVELETEKRALKRATEKNKSKDRELELQQQLDDLRTDLAREKREMEKARAEAENELDAKKRALQQTADKNDSREGELELQQQLEVLKRDLARENRENEKARKEAKKELEVRQRASRQAAEKGSGERERLLELQQQFENLQNELSQERQDKEKVRKQAKQEAMASENQKSVLESKLDQMRTKLRATKEQLKDCQADLDQIQAPAANKANTPVRKSIPTKNPRKRAAVEMSTDAGLGTPDGVAVRGKRPAAKKGRMDQTMLGEKSMFSITPYLRKTASFLPESPLLEEEHEEESTKVHGDDNGTVCQAPKDARQSKEDLTAANSNYTSPSAAPKSKATKKMAEKKLSPEQQILGIASFGISNRKPGPKTSKAISKLERVMEEVGIENEDATETTSTATANTGDEPHKPSRLQVKNLEDEPKKKKRKLLSAGGKTLFDEEDGEATKRTVKVVLGPPRLLGKGGLAGPKGGLKGGHTAKGGFSAFSPLKKDRRGTGASFLA